MKLKFRTKHLLVVSLLAITLFVNSMNSQPTKATKPNILSVTHQPTFVSHQTNVTVTVTFDDDTNVTDPKIQYCSLEPSYACHFPKIDMIKNQTNVWKGSFVVQEESGIIGYEIHFTYNETTVVAPNSTDYLGYSNIIEPSPGLFYFSIELDMTTETAPLNIGSPLVALTFATFVLLKKRKSSK